MKPQVNREYRHGYRTEFAGRENEYIQTIQTLTERSGMLRQDVQGVDKPPLSQAIRVTEQPSTMFKLLRKEWLNIPFPIVENIVEVVVKNSSFLINLVSALCSI